MSPPVLAYYWAGKANFGDLLTPLILKHFCGVDSLWVDPLFADIVVAGSVLDVLPVMYQGIVAGAGQLHDKTHADLRHAQVFGLRGKLTAERAMLNLLAPDFVIGDPGLLVSEMVPAAAPGSIELGIVPHWSDQELFKTEWQRAKRYDYALPKLIDTTGDPVDVAAAIGSCKKIVASSLHGIIVADSYGVPRRAEKFPNIDSIHEGGTFKYRDYASALDQDIGFGILRTAPRDTVITIQAQLFAMFQRVASYVAS